MTTGAGNAGFRGMSAVNSNVSSKQTLCHTHTHTHTHTRQVRELLESEAEELRHNTDWVLIV
jgi:hypothetical protein